MPFTFDDAVRIALPLRPVKQQPEDRIIEAVIGDLRVTDPPCADCQVPMPRDQGWFVPWGTHVICRACRDARLART